MAEVFEAEVVGELGFVRKVAIKRMLDSAAADAGAARRFVDEARIASRLHHANIVAVTDVGLLDGLPFQVLELVDGIDAHQLQQRAGGRLPLEIALVICADVAHALDHAHRATDADGIPLGVVHRDVKPSNVLVSWAGDVKLTDFGIALARDRSARTETGLVAGTQGFIAPEQRTRSEVDGRADVFAIGLTLHAFLTGDTPLRDISVEMDLLAGTPVPLDPTLPADVRELIARAVAPARLDRPTAGELASALGAALAPRLTRDPRSTLRAFLAGLDPSTHRPRRGALDGLLGIAVVPADAAPADGDVPQFKTVAASDTPTVHARMPRSDEQSGDERHGDAKRGGDGATVLRGDDRGDDDAAGPARRDVSRRRRSGVVIAGAFVLVAAGAVGAWQLATRGSAALTHGDAGAGSSVALGGAGGGSSAATAGAGGEGGGSTVATGGTGGAGGGSSAATGGAGGGSSVVTSGAGDSSGAMGGAGGARGAGDSSGAMRGTGGAGGASASSGSTVGAGAARDSSVVTSGAGGAGGGSSVALGGASDSSVAIGRAGDAGGANDRPVATSGAGGDDRQPVTDTGRPRDRRRATATTRPTTPARAATTATGAPPAVVETGWLQVIGGEELVGARVVVDGGKWKFSVPHKHEVAVGVHRVEVVKPDGTRLPAKTIEVTTFHTMRNAARLRF